jgi:Ni/Fe-hydrogenase subunit HybB-like protein
MELTFRSVEGNSKGYKTLVGILGAFVVAGFGAYIYSYLQGFQVWGISNSICWGQLITVDIYFIGLSAGSLVVSSLTYVFNKDEYKPLGRMAVFMGLLLMTGAMCCVIPDLGRPEGCWRLFGFFYTNNMTSMFAINGIFYGGYLALLVTYLALALKGSDKTKIIAPIAVLWAFTVHMGTGAIFGFMGSRHIMYSSLKPVEFISAAFASGVALVLILSLITLKANHRQIDKDMFQKLGRLLAVLIIILVVLVATDKLTHWYPASRDSMSYLLFGQYWWIFWVMQLFIAYVIPLVILLHPKWGKSITGIAIACVLNVVGIFGERMAIIFPGLSETQHIYQDHIVGWFGTPAGFPITPTETLISVGIFALLGLLYVLGLKYLNLVPGEPMVEEAPVPVEGESAIAQTSESSDPPEGQENPSAEPDTS